MNKKMELGLIIIVVILMSVLFCGCAEIDEIGYEYTGIRSEVNLSKISNNEFNNDTLKKLLKDKLEIDFYNVTTEEENLYIWYNEKKYVGYNKLENNKATQSQYSKIEFLTNRSIMIISRVYRRPGFKGIVCESENVAEEKSKDLIQEDITYLNSQILKTVEIIQSVYNTHIISEEYSPEFDI
jgi:hypothetical protein